MLCAGVATAMNLHSDKLPILQNRQINTIFVNKTQPNMNKRLFFAFAFVLMASATAMAQESIYLSPKGDDMQGDGSKERPFYSLTQAFNSAAAAKQTADTLFVEVASGDYFMERTLMIEKPNTRPIVVRGDAEQMPRLMGGKRIEGWEHWRDGIYRAYIPEVERYGFSFEQFYFIKS